MNSVFFRDDQKDVCYSYEHFLQQLHSQPLFYTSIYAHHLPDFYLNLILGMLHDAHITILDDWTGMHPSGERPNFLSLGAEEMSSIGGVEELVERLRQSEASISILTSGSSGRPKRVTHSVKKILAMVRMGASYQNDRWLLAYDPGHMAGLQVFFQALLNGNELVNGFAYSAKTVFNQLRKYEISHLSATPTFYRLLLASGEHYRGLKRLTIGGERSDKALHESLSLSFPGSKINNIYSTTESGTLFVSDGIYFSIPIHLASRIRMVDDELHLHNSLLGNAGFAVGEWYATGDRIAWNEKGQFCFVSRHTDIVNVGGYMVNLGEIEEQLGKMTGVKNYRVFTRKNALIGHLICCDLVVSDPNLKAINFKKQLMVLLAAHKVPRIINIVEQIGMTPRGKVNRYEERTGERYLQRPGV